MSSRMRKRWIEKILSGHVIRCGICHEPITIVKATGPNRLKRGGRGSISVDHIKPKAWGGKDRAGNLQPTHALCNQTKGNRLPEQFIETEPGLPTPY